MHISSTKTLKSMFSLSALQTFHWNKLSELCCKIMIQAVAMEISIPELNKIVPQFCALHALYYTKTKKSFVSQRLGPVAHDCGTPKIEKNNENGCCCCCNNIIILTKGVGHIALVILFKYNMFQFKSEFGSWIAING